MLLNGMHWGGENEWFTKPRGLWVNPKNAEMPAGYAKSFKGLDFVVVYNSGHLVPFNQPENALDLISRFIRNETFYDYPLPDFDFYHKTVNPGTSLANGMYPLTTMEDILQRPSHHGLFLIFAVLVSFAAGVLTSSYLAGWRQGYQKL
jgi:Serine carboxypeptidase